MMTVCFPPLEPWQQEVVDIYKEDMQNAERGKWYVTRSVRQCGKSILAQILLIYSSLLEGNSVSLCISPTISQARKMFQDILKMAERLIKRSNGSTMEITFINDSRVLFKSAQQSENVRGFTVRKSGICIIDEAAYIPDDFIYSIIVPTTNVFSAPIFFFSTPRYRRGAFYDLYIQGFGSNPKIKSFDWTQYDLSKYLSAETLEIYRKQLPKSAFKAEYLGEFIDGDSSVFGEFKGCMGESDLNMSQPIYLSIDWSAGTQNDYTVLAFEQIQGDKIVVPNLIRFNDRTSSDTISIIGEEVGKLIEKGARDVQIIVERNGIGAVFLSSLVDKIDQMEEEFKRIHWLDDINLNLQSFITTNKTKERGIKKLCKLIEDKKIVLPNNQELAVELGAFEVKVNNNGVPTYNAMSGYNDDCICSIMFAADTLYNELYDN